MKRPALCALLILPLSGACRDDDAPATQAASDAAVDASLPIGRMDAGQTPLIELVRSEIDLYDRRIRAGCPCLVASGAYPSVAECLRLGLSGPDWASCEARALANYDSPSTRDKSQCYFQYLAEAAMCTEAAACDKDKLASCGTPDLDCLASQNERLNLVIAACPDFGLLGRAPSSEVGLDASMAHAADASTGDAR